MQHIRILAVGSLSEKYYKDAQSEYLKRLSRYAAVKVEEVADEPLPKADSPLLQKQAVDKEGERLLKRLENGERVVVLDLGGKQLTSEQFACRISAWQDRHTTVIIGGSCGISAAVLAAADEKIKLSEMTFTHNMARLILLEQIYRGYKINNNEKYHK